MCWPVPLWDNAVSAVECVDRTKTNMQGNEPKEGGM